MKIEKVIGKGTEYPYPQYDCHKVVRAFKVKEIVSCGVPDSFVLMPEDPTMPGLLMKKAWGAKYSIDGDCTSMVGGYVVFYADGWISWSTARAFENGYTLKAKEDEHRTTA